MRLRNLIGRGGPLLVLALAFALAPSWAAASPQGSDTLQIEAVLAAVQTANPSLAAVRLRAAAARERVPQAGALPDPMVSLGLMNRPVDNLGPDHAMTMNSVQLTQSFPWPGTRGALRQRSSFLASASQFDAEEAEATLIARAKSTYYRLAEVDRAIEVTQSTRTLLRDFVEVTTTRYAVGSGLQQDVLQAQVAVAEATAGIAVLEERRSSLAARLNAFMGRTAADAIGQLRLPGPGPELPAVEVLLAQALDVRPALNGARERVRAAEAGIQSAERQRYPALTVTVGYGQRPRFDDLATVMLGVSVPVWSGSKQIPQRREMEAVQATELAFEEDLSVQTHARLTELRAQAERARSLHGLYRTSILPQAAAAVESALSAYRVGNVDYMTLLSNQMTVNRFQIESLRLAADYHSAVAEIEALTGPETRGES